jgi:hypothetical protein
MEEMISSPKSPIAGLTPGDGKPQGQGNGTRRPKAKAAAAMSPTTSRPNQDDLLELTATDTLQKHQLDELA